MSLISTQDQSFRLVLHETLLDGLERTGHEVEYQCRSGYCGMCRVKIMRGDVRYLEQPLAFVAHDEVLPCCCVPVSDIKLDCRLRPEFIILQDQPDLFPLQQSLFTEQEIPLLKKTKPIAKRKNRTTRHKRDSERNLVLF